MSVGLLLLKAHRGPRQPAHDGRMLWPLTKRQFLDFDGNKLKIGES